MCPLKVDLFSVTFDPKMAEIRWLTVTHPIGGHYVATITYALAVAKKRALLWQPFCIAN